jgi:hypothetical protein
VRGLYFVGGATHPGGGVTLAMRGGRFVAELMARDCGSDLRGASQWADRDRLTVDLAAP